MNQGSLAIAENGYGLAKQGSINDQILGQGTKSSIKGTAVLNGQWRLTEGSVRARAPVVVTQGTTEDGNAEAALLWLRQGSVRTTAGQWHWRQSRATRNSGSGCRRRQKLGAQGNGGGRG